MSVYVSFDLIKELLFFYDCLKYGSGGVKAAECLFNTPLNGKEKKIQWKLDPTVLKRHENLAKSTVKS